METAQSSMQLYQHRNLALAVTLATCGVPFPKDREGNDVPFIHFYDVVTLRKMKDEQGRPRYKGWEPMAAAQDAWRNGLRGTVVYQSLHCELLEKILRAYDKHSQMLIAADEGGAPAICNLQIQPEEAARLCCQFTKNRNVFQEGWQKVVPYLEIAGPLRREPDGDRTVFVGSFKLTRLKP